MRSLICWSKKTKISEMKRSVCAKFPAIWERIGSDASETVEAGSRMPKNSRSSTTFTRQQRKARMTAGSRNAYGRRRPAEDLSAIKTNTVCMRYTNPKNDQIAMAPCKNYKLERKQMRLGLFLLFPEVRLKMEFFSAQQHTTKTIKQRRL